MARIPRIVRHGTEVIRTLELLKGALEVMLASKCWQFNYYEMAIDISGFQKINERKAMQRHSMAFSVSFPQYGAF